MRVWRLTRRKYLEEAFTGKGAVEQGGRWNAEGTAVVYTASSLALAVLELFVNLDLWETPALIAIPVEIPPEVQIAELPDSKLPPGWRNFQQPPSTQQIGTQWCDRGDSAVLSVPSVVIPQERNYVLNPAHQHFHRISIGKPEPFSFDPRMWK
jgi:RES domain-containing protein